MRSLTDLIWFLILQNFMELKEMQHAVVVSLVGFLGSWVIVLRQSCLFIYLYGCFIRKLFSKPYSSNNYEPIFLLLRSFTFGLCSALRYGEFWRYGDHQRFLSKKVTCILWSDNLIVTSQCVCFEYGVAGTWVRSKELRPPSANQRWGLDFTYIS